MENCSEQVKVLKDLLVELISGIPGLKTSYSYFTTLYESFYYLNSPSVIGDFPETYFTQLVQIHKENKFLTNNLYKSDIPIIDQFTPEELECGLLKLIDERDNLITETQKYIPSSVTTSFDFLIFINTFFNNAIRRTWEYIRIMKLENPSINFKIRSKKGRLKEPPIYTIYTTPSRSLLHRDMLLSDDRFSFDSQITKFSLKNKYDRFTGGDLSDVDSVIKYYKLHKQRNLFPDEQVLSQLLTIIANKNDPVLHQYLSKIVDSNLVLNNNNFRDLYIVVINPKNPPSVDSPLDDYFWNNYEMIKKTVLSPEIRKFSPRLVKLVVTLETA